MADHESFFKACASIVATAGRGVTARSREFEFLQALGYLGDNEESSPQLPRQLAKNRETLLLLAARFERVFQLPMQHAPGAHFFGGMISAGTFGIGDHGDRQVGVGGRGQTLKRAFESCIGEAAEYLSFIERDDDPLLKTGSNGNTPSESELAWLLDGIGVGHDIEPDLLDWIEAHALDENQKVLFPSELVLRRPEHKRLGNRQAESTGIGAGPTFDDAVYSSLMEVIERDAVALWWYGGYRARAVSQRVRDQAGYTSFVNQIRGEAVRNDWILDISTDINVPVIAAVSSNQDGSAIVAGFCADLDIDKAVRGAFLETCQMELAQEISLSKRRRDPNAPLNDQDTTWIARHEGLSVANFPQFEADKDSDVPIPQTNVGGLDTVVRTLLEKGYRPYVCDLTRDDISIPVVKVLVPGMQSIKPDWITPRLMSTAETNGVSLPDSLKQLCPI